MNLDIIKNDISKHVGKYVIITQRGSRNRKEIYEGYLYNIYPNIFTIKCSNSEKSFLWILRLVARRVPFPFPSDGDSWQMGRP